MRVKYSLSPVQLLDYVCVCVCVCVCDTDDYKCKN